MSWAIEHIGAWCCQETMPFTYPCGGAVNTSLVGDVGQEEHTCLASGASQLAFSLLGCTYGQSVLLALKVDALQIKGHSSSQSSRLVRSRCAHC